MNIKKSKEHKPLKLYPNSKIKRMYAAEDKFFDSLFESEKFKNGVLALHAELDALGEPPDLMKQPEHHCTVHRNDPTYAKWDKPIDDFCNQFDIDAGNDLQFGPRYRIEQHILFGKPLTNFFHPLIKCQTELSPVPHISRISIMPPSQPLSVSEKNWLMDDVESMLMKIQPKYPFTPSTIVELFDGIDNKDVNIFKQRLEEAIAKRLIVRPTDDAHALACLIEDLRDGHELQFKEIASILGISEDAAFKRYNRATSMQMV
jgi:hypothetical protein